MRSLRRRLAFWQVFDSILRSFCPPPQPTITLSGVFNDDDPLPVQLNQPRSVPQTAATAPGNMAPAVPGNMGAGHHHNAGVNGYQAANTGTNVHMSQGRAMVNVNVGDEFKRIAFLSLCIAKRHAAGWNNAESIRAYNAAQNIVNALCEIMMH